MRTHPRCSVTSVCCAGLLFLAGTPARADAPDFKLTDGLALTPYLTAQGDGAAFTQDRPGGQASGGNLRRMQIGTTLKIEDQFEVGYVYDFGHSVGGAARTLTADITYLGLRPLRLTIGIQKPQFSMESMEDGADIVFIERSSIANVTRNVAASSGRKAIQLQALRRRWLVAAALTEGMTGHPDDARQRALVGRAVGLVIDEPALTVEIGGSAQYAYRLAAGMDGRPSLSLSEFVELSVSPAADSVATGALSARCASVAGGETSIRTGRLLLQGEWYRIAVNRYGGARDLAFHGGYAQAAYTILGAPRSWNDRLGVWATPRSGSGRGAVPGAVEIAARYSQINLDDRDVSGRRQAIWTAAVNWWPLNPVRLTAELLHGDVVGGRSPRNVNALAGRVQLHF